MPVLRNPADPSIGEGFGNLGAALGTALDPRMRAQAQMLQLEMQQRLQQMQELQRKFGARDDLKRQYLSLPPSQRAAVDNMIEAGSSQLDIEKYLGMQGLVNSPDTTDPATTKANIGNTIRLTGQPYTSPGAPVVGPQTSVEAEIARQIAEYNKAHATAAGTTAGQGVPTDQQRVFPGGGAPGSFTPGGFDPITGRPVSGALSGANPTAPPAQTPPVSPAAAAAPASSASSPNLTSGASGANAAPLGGLPPPIRTLPDGTVVTGYSPAEKSAADERNKAVWAEIVPTMNKIEGVYKVRSIIQQVRDLEKLTQTGGALGQLDAAVRQHLVNEYGMTPTQAGSAQQAIQTLLWETLPGIRSQYGLIRVAGPEIQGVVKPTIGSSAMTSGALDTILAQEAAGTNLDETDATNARKVFSGQMSPDDYFAAKAANAGQLPGIVAGYNKAFGNLANAAAQPPAQPGESQTPQSQQTQPPPQSGGFLNELGGFFEHLFGAGSTPGSSATPPPPPSPDSTHVIMQNGVWTPVQQ